MATSSFQPITTPETPPAPLTKAAVGLANVDNTSDANKPVSLKQAQAIEKEVSDAFDAVVDAAVDATEQTLKVPIDTNLYIFNPTTQLYDQIDVSKFDPAKLADVLVNNATALQKLKTALGTTGSGGGTVTPEPSSTYPSLAGAKSYITSFDDGQTPFKGYRTLTYGTSGFGVYYLGAAEGWGGGNNTGLVKDKIPVGVASAIAWDLPADGLLGGQSTGVAISDNLTDYFRGYYSTPITLGIFNGKFQWNINGQETFSNIAAPSSGPNTIIVIDVPASGNITARYTTDGSTWTVITGFSVARPAIDLGIAPFIEQANRIYNFRATNLQPI